MALRNVGCAIAPIPPSAPISPRALAMSAHGASLGVSRSFGCPRGRRVVPLPCPEASGALPAPAPVPLPSPLPPAASGAQLLGRWRGAGQVWAGRLFRLMMACLVRSWQASSSQPENPSRRSRQPPKLSNGCRNVVKQCRPVASGVGSGRGALHERPRLGIAPSSMLYFHSGRFSCPPCAGAVARLLAGPFAIDDACVGRDDRRVGMGRR